jgi:hypothetical protein
MYLGRKKEITWKSKEWRTYYTKKFDDGGSHKQAPSKGENYTTFQVSKLHFLS